MILGKFSLPPALKVLAIYFIALLILMQFWHGIFLLSQISFLQTENIFHYIQSFWVALRLDAVVTGYLVLPVLLTTFLPYFGWSSQLYKIIIRFYFGIIVFIYSFLSVVDIEFYKELGSHLNLIIWQPGTFSTEVWKLIWLEYPIIWYLIGITIFSYFWIKISNKYIDSINDRITGILTNFLSFFFVLIIIGLSCRGGWQERPIDWGHAMFSKDQIANQTALNPIFNLSRSVLQLLSEEKVSSLLKYMDNANAMDITRKLIQSPNERFIDSTSFIRKIVITQSIKPNIVLVVLESFVANFCGYINPEMSNVTPNLDKLARNGIMCTNCVALGKRSAYGLGSILCSWPALPGYPIISQLESQGNTQSIASLLKEIGYSTTFIYGGDADFDNMKGFAIANGFDQVIEQDDFPFNTPGTMWGIFDEYIFKKTESILDSTKNPVLITLFTTTNHQPWKIPKSRENDVPIFQNTNFRMGKALRTMAYTDLVIGEFIQNNENKTWFDNTIFVFISDHSLNVYDGMFEDPRNAHIPFIIYAPEIIKSPLVIDKITNQADVVPTLLHLIGYSGSFDLLGCNILSNELNGFACRIVNDHCTWFESDNLYIENLGQNNKLIRYSDLYKYPYEVVMENKMTKEGIQLNFHAYLQSAYNYFKSRNNRKIPLNN